MSCEELVELDHVEILVQKARLDEDEENQILLRNKDLSNVNILFFEPADKVEIVLALLLGFSEAERRS